MDYYGFYTGIEFEAQEYLGAHFTEDGVVFRTFAPAAAGVTLLLGDAGTKIPMNQIYDGNFYEVEVAGVEEGECYEYRIFKQDGSYTDHSDPFGFEMQLRPEHKSIVCKMGDKAFGDSKWMKKRSDCKNQPLNIYELHMGSWRKKGEGATDWYRYDEVAEMLVPHLKEAGYNYIELLPLAEHPCDESWGYQNTGFFAPTSRYGTAKDLKKMVAYFHEHEIGVLLDYVPVHFAVDAYALASYDGTALFEYPHQDVGISEWGSYNFMHSRGEVRSYLQSAANYWLKEYHFDGLRMDAISRIIFWQGDESRGENRNAVEFIRVMNRGLKEKNPGCMLIAEDSTNYPNVTKSVEQGGLGFDYKWDMGWMHDTLNYFKTAPEYRSENYHKLTFSMMYYWNENYIMPFSHDEVVHGKTTILQKMYGEYEEKFSQARALYLYMMMHPGKKLNFMGNEIGQLREWDEKREQDWDLLKYPAHDGFYHYMCRLNHIYQEHSALWQEDYVESGFRWLDCHQEKRCIYSMSRESEEEVLAAIFNLGNMEQKDYEVETEAEEMEILLDTDWQKFGGSTPEQNENIKLEKGKIKCTLPPYSGILIRLIK